MSATCLLLVVLIVVCCMLWRNAKRQSDRYYKDLIMMPDAEPIGIENRDHYEYTDQPLKTPMNVGTNSSSSIKSSAVSLKELPSYNIKSSNGETRKGTPVLTSKRVSKTSQSDLIVPQTDV